MTDVPNATGWRADGPFVYPLNDLREHDVENPKCWCQPFYEDHILVHNSLDQRELNEPDRKIR